MSKVKKDHLWMAWSDEYEWFVPILYASSKGKCEAQIKASQVDCIPVRVEIREVKKRKAKVKK